MNRPQEKTGSPNVCPDRRVLILDAIWPEMVPDALRHWMFEHLCSCSHCVKLYGEICDIDRNAAGPSTDLSSDAALQAAGFMTQEESLRELWRRIAAMEASPGIRSCHGRRQPSRSHRRAAGPLRLRRPDRRGDGFPQRN